MRLCGARGYAAAKAMLEQEGFRYEGYVDIFDAGPTLECFRDDIHAARQSQLLPVALGDHDPVPDSLTDNVPWLVGNRKFADWRAILASAPLARSTAFLMPMPRLARRQGRRSSARGAAVAAGSMTACASTWKDRDNFDGIPGPTHNYAGLAHGNLAATRNASLVANPREAALWAGENARAGGARLRAGGGAASRATRARAACAGFRRNRCAGDRGGGA